MGHRTSVLLLKKKKNENYEYLIFLIIDELESNLECWWGNQELHLLDLKCWLRIISSSIWRFKATKSYLYLCLNLGWLSAFSVSIWIWGDWDVYLSRFESKVTERFLYLSLNLRWLRAISILGLSLGRLRDFSISV